MDDETTRLKILSEIFRPVWVRIVSPALAMLGLYDVTLSQIIPKEFGDKFPKAYQAMNFVASLAPYWVWFVLSAIGILVAVVEREVRKHPKPPNAPPFPYAPPQLPTWAGRPLQQSHTSEPSKHAAVPAPPEVRLPANPVIARTATPEAESKTEINNPIVAHETTRKEYSVEQYRKEHPLDYSILFESRYQDISLKFLPDGRDKNLDALILIVYGNKILRNKGELSSADADRSLASSKCAIEFTKMTFYPWITSDELMQTFPAQTYLTKAGLSRGGFLSLTDAGLKRAEDLAWDLIGRA